MKKTDDVIKNRISISDEDTIQLDYDDLKDLLGDTDIDFDDLQ